MNDYPLISVVILNWNRLEDTKHAIESVLRQTYSHYEIIVIDNHSEEPGSESLPQIYPGIRFFEMQKNHGCPGGRNIGIDLAKGEYVFFVDNDGILESHALENAYKAFQENDHIGIVAGKMIYYDPKYLFISEDNKAHLKSNNGWYSYGFTGCVTMHKRSIYDKIGMFNADFMYGGEETNLSLRLLTIDQYVFYADDVVLWHKKSEQARPRQFNFISACSNMYYTYMQLMPWEFKILFFFYFTLKYPFYALKNGYFIPFLKAMPRIYLRKRNYSGRRIKLTPKEVYLYQELRRSKIKQYDELKTIRESFRYSKLISTLFSFKL